MTLSTGTVELAHSPRKFPTAPVLVMATTVGLVAAAPAVLAAHSFGFVCPIKALTGFDCPGCGLTRAFASLAHGDVYHAADHNLLFVASLPFLAVWWVMWVRATIQGRPAPMPKAKYAYMFFAIAIIFTVVRNIPGVPFLGSA